jgi:hypothetical protein
MEKLFSKKSLLIEKKLIGRLLSHMCLLSTGHCLTKGLNYKAFKDMFPLAMFLRLKYQQQQHATVTIVLALATLGGATQIGSFILAKDCHVMLLMTFSPTNSMYTSLNSAKLWCHDTQYNDTQHNDIQHNKT